MKGSSANESHITPPCFRPQTQSDSTCAVDGTDDSFDLCSSHFFAATDSAVVSDGKSILGLTGPP